MKGGQLDTHIWVVGYRLKRLDEPIFMAVPKPMLTEFGIQYILESCVIHQTLSTAVFPTPHREREWEKSQHLLINISPFLKR